MTEAKGPSVGPSAPSVQRLVIDRSRWLRGEGGDDSYLLRAKDEKMCCLGFYGLACGFALDDLRSVGAPYASPAHRSWPQWLMEYTPAGAPMPSSACRALIGFNDAQALDCATREQQIAAIFAGHGIEVVFTDGEASTASARNAPPDESRAGSTEGKEKP